MVNTLLTPQIIARMAMVELDNEIVLAKQVYREYRQEFRKVGDTVDIRRPLQFVAGSGAVATAQDVVDANTSITVSEQSHVLLEFTSTDLTLREDQFADRIVRPVMRELANKIDSFVAGRYVQIPHWVGTPGQLVNSFADLAKGPERLDHNGVSRSGRIAVMSPGDTWAMAGSASALFNQQITADAWRRGELGNIAGMDMFSTQNVATHTVGALGGTPLVNGAAQNVTYAASKDTYTQTLNIDGATISVTNWARAGDVFTIANVFDVNPVTKAALPHLRQFVVTANASSNGSGQVALTISPPIITSGAYQTVSAAPADNAAVAVVGTAATGYAQNLVMHKNCIALVVVDLEKPPTASFSAVERFNGFSARVIGSFDIINDKSQLRFDVLYGARAVNPELGTRISGTA